MCTARSVCGGRCVIGGGEWVSTVLWICVHGCMFGSVGLVGLCACINVSSGVCIMVCKGMRAM